MAATLPLVSGEIKPLVSVTKSSTEPTFGVRLSVQNPELFENRAIDEISAMKTTIGKFWLITEAIHSVALFIAPSYGNELNRWPCQPYRSPCWEQCEQLHFDDLILGNYKSQRVRPPPFMKGESFRVTLFNAYFFRTSLALELYTENKNSIVFLLNRKDAFFLPFGHLLVALKNIPEGSSGGLVEDEVLKTGFVVLAHSYEKFSP